MACGAEAASPQGGATPPPLFYRRVHLLSPAVKERGIAKHFPVRKVYKVAMQSSRKFGKLSPSQPFLSLTTQLFGLPRRLNRRTVNKMHFFSFPSISELSMVCLQDTETG
jgi:hypothetical protein